MKKVDEFDGPIIVVAGGGEFGCNLDWTLSKTHSRFVLHNHTYIARNIYPLAITYIIFIKIKGPFWIHLTSLHWTTGYLTRRRSTKDQLQEKRFFSSFLIWRPVDFKIT